MGALPVLALLGTEDESVPESVDKGAHLASLCSALGPHTTAALVEGATHGFVHAERPVADALAAFVGAGCDLAAHPLDVEGVRVVATRAS